MGKALYYLVARDRETNDFEILKINGKRGVSLEQIDLFTTQFQDEYDMNSHYNLYDNTDFFIVSQSKFNGEIILKKYEVLYNLNSYISEIAENSLNGEITKSEKQIDRILDYFAGQVYKKPSLYDLLITGKTNVYDRYAKYFAYTNYDSIYSIKYRDGGWARNSYPLVRNTLDALSHIIRQSKDISDQMYRGFLDNELIRVTDKDYDENQLSLFDERSDEDNNCFKIMREIEFIPQKVFTIDREGNTIFNRNNFIGCDSWDLECLESFLPEQLCSYINVYTIHRDSLDYGYYPMCNSYIDPVMRDQEVIIDYLKSNKQLIPQIISWLDIYNANKDKVLGDVINGGYQKRK